MRFLVRYRIGAWRVTLSVGRVTEVHGINSDLRDGNHIVMWEFDETDWSKVRSALLIAQKNHGLSTIYVARSHPGGGYHAYCIMSLPWIRTVHIVSGTQLVDPGYIGMCAMRGHWTLRLTDKGIGAPEHWQQLPSGVMETTTIYNLTGYVKYEAFKSKRILGWGKRGH